jgi:8-oxo-dGTP diphosphatase
MDPAIEVISRGVLLRDSHILLCQNVKQGYWYLPGGHVEFGEAAAASLAREFMEECGLEIEVLDCVLVAEAGFAAKRQHHEINLVFRVEEKSDRDAEVVSREPAVAFGWFGTAQVAEVDLRPAAVKAWLLAGGRQEGGSCTWVSEIRS